MTASFPPSLYQSFFFLPFSCSRSSFLHSLGRCNGSCPSLSASFLVLYALRAESTTSYLNFMLYPEYCILRTISLTFYTTLSHGNNLPPFIRTLRTSWVSTVLLVLQFKADLAFMMVSTIQATKPRMRYKDGQTYVDESSVTEDGRVSSDERTMALIKKVGNGIHSSIQLEVDYPSKHQDGKLPIIDLKVWAESQGRRKQK